MPVDTPHKEVEDLAPSWQTVRDVVTGSRAVKNAGPRYLPRLRKQTNDEYEAYKYRALFVDATKRTHDGYMGLLFRKPPVFTIPRPYMPFLDDVTLSGVPFEAFAKQAMGQVLAPGRCGIMVELPQLPPGPAVTQPRPYMHWYAAGNIVNWRIEMINGVRTLTRLILREDVLEPDPKDEFVDRTVEQYRVCLLANGGLWHVLFRKQTIRNKPSDQWLPYGEPIPIVRRDELLQFIPFVFWNPTSIEPECQEPPMLGLAEINLSLYRTSADLETGRHFTGLPQPYAFGVKTKELYIGSTKAWTSENENAKCGYVEVAGDFGALTKAVDEKTAQMVVQGAKLLEPQSRGAEAYDTVKLRKAGEESPLVSMAQTGGHALERALAYFVYLAAGTGDIATIQKQVTCKVNQEFEELIMDGSTAVQLVQVWQQRGISRQTLIYNYERGGLLPPDRTAEQEQALIEAEEMAAMQQVAAMNLDQPAQQAA
jgi:hypothetical protein